MHRSEFILRFRFNRESGDEQAYIDLILEKASKSTIIHIEPSGDGVYLTLTYDLSLKSGISSQDIVTGLNSIPGIDNVNLVTATNDIDY